MILKGVYNLCTKKDNDPGEIDPYQEYRNDRRDHRIRQPLLG